MIRLSVQDLGEYLNKDFAFIDIRDANEFASGFITGSIFLRVDEKFAESLSNFASKDATVVFVCDEESTFELMIDRVRSVTKGLNVAGYFVWEKKNRDGLLAMIDLVIEVDVEEFLMDLKFDESLLPVDLRSAEEFRKSHLRKSVSLPLREMSDVAQIASLEEDSNIYFYGEDEDALTAASIVKRQGIQNVRIVNGGWRAILENPEFEIERLPKAK